jgi:hypothetical protein
MFNLIYWAMSMIESENQYVVHLVGAGVQIKDIGVAGIRV